MLDGTLSARIDLVELSVRSCSSSAKDLVTRDDGGGLEVDRVAVGLVDNPRRKLLRRLEHVHGAFVSDGEARKSAGSSANASNPTVRSECLLERNINGRCERQ